VRAVDRYQSSTETIVVLLVRGSSTYSDCRLASGSDKHADRSGAGGVDSTGDETDPKQGLKCLIGEAALQMGKGV